MDLLILFINCEQTSHRYTYPNCPQFRMRICIIISLFSLSYGTYQKYQMCNWPNNCKCPMVAAILDILTYKQSVESQIDHLLTAVCPQVAMMTQEECVDRMPDFWRSAGVQLWNYYFGSAFCQELAECPSKGQKGSMTCDFCVLNLIDTIDTLTDDIYMITGWRSILLQWSVSWRRGDMCSNHQGSSAPLFVIHSRCL